MLAGIFEIALFTVFDLLGARVSGWILAFAYLSIALVGWFIGIPLDSRRWKKALRRASNG
jgi:hypothetical protein